MSRSSVIVSGLRLLAATATAVLLFGCGTTPVSPTAGGGLPAPPVLMVADDGSVAYKGADTLEQDWDAQGEDRLLTVSKRVTREDGGWLQCGRFLLVLPAGALDSTATVTMSMHDSTAMVVDLEISPRWLNRFDKPVLLSVNTTGTTAPTDSLAIYWFDPGDDSWVGMSTEKTLTSTKYCLDQVAAGDLNAPDLSPAGTSGLSTQLSHFSRYSAGKAGW